MFVSFVVITSLLQVYLLWSLATRHSMPENGALCIQENTESSMESHAAKTRSR